MSNNGCKAVRQHRTCNVIHFGKVSLRGHSDSTPQHPCDSPQRKGVLVCICLTDIIPSAQDGVWQAVVFCVVVEWMSDTIQYDLQLNFSWKKLFPSPDSKPAPLFTFSILTNGATTLPASQLFWLLSFPYSHFQSIREYFGSSYVMWPESDSFSPPSLRPQYK